MEYLYILRTYGKNGSLLKFGYTEDITARINQYKHANPLIEILHMWKLPNAKSIETNFHLKNKSNIGREWYEESMYQTIMDYVNTYETIKVSCYKENKKPKMLNFKETVIEMQKGDSDVILQAFKQYPFLHEAIEKIDYKGIEESNYSITGVKRKIIRLSAGSDRTKISQSLKASSYIYEGAFVESNTLKKLFNTVYKSLGLTLTPKANDIVNYFHVKEHTKRIKVETPINTGKLLAMKVEWKSIKGYVIIKSKS